MQLIRYGLVVRIAGSHPAGPGSFPGNGRSFGKLLGWGANTCFSQLPLLGWVHFYTIPCNCLLKFLSEEGFEASPTEVDCDLNAAP